MSICAYVRPCLLCVCCDAQVVSVYLLNAIHYRIVYVIMQKYKLHHMKSVPINMVTYTYVVLSPYKVTKHSHVTKLPYMVWFEF